MTTLSCRGPIVLPDGYTVAYLDADLFGTDLMMCMEWDKWESARLPAVARHYLFLFAGYNQAPQGWYDPASDGARSIALWVRDYDIPYQVVNCLWPGLGETFVQKVQFHWARENAQESAKRYAPLIDKLLEGGATVSFMGHSCGCWLIHELIQCLQHHEAIKAVILMEAAMRQSEFKTVILSDHPHVFWLNFHSSRDSALRQMQLDFVDEAGNWWVAIRRLFHFENQANEPIVGMHGIPSILPNVTNVELTTTIRQRHSDGRHVPQVWQKIAALLKHGKLGHKHLSIHE